MSNPYRLCREVLKLGNWEASKEEKKSPALRLQITVRRNTKISEGGEEEEFVVKKVLLFFPAPLTSKRQGRKEEMAIDHHTAREVNNCTSHEDSIN